MQFLDNGSMLSIQERNGRPRGRCSCDVLMGALHTLRHKYIAVGRLPIDRVMNPIECSSTLVFLEQVPCKELQSGNFLLAQRAII
jgi:hypothetical protein